MNKIELSCIIKCDIAAPSQSFQIKIPVPRNTQFVKIHTDSSDSHSEYIDQDKKVVFTMKKFLGNSEIHLQVGTIIIIIILKRKT